MSKVKPPKKSKGTPNKHLHARTTFLYQAATYLTLQTAAHETGEYDAIENKQTVQAHEHQVRRCSPLALELCSDLQQVSRKAQLRLSVHLKRSICKNCNSVLVPGRTARQTVENPSKGGKKSWADVLVLECGMCGGKKRFPVGAERQSKKVKRRIASRKSTSITSLEDTRQTALTARTGTEPSSNTDSKEKE